MRNKTLKTLVWAMACVLLAITAGCKSTGGETPLPAPIMQPPYFPPQAVMQSGDYAAFKAENEEALKSCKEPDKCAEAVLNISFLYSYSRSPYFNPARGILSLEDLIKGAPETPWAYQARVWIDLMKKGLPKHAKRRPAKEDAKAREAAHAESQREGAGIGQADGTAVVQTGGRPDGPAMEAGRAQLEEELRSKEDTIRELNRQLERSRQIDLEIDRKQRRLPY